MAGSDLLDKLRLALPDSLKALLPADLSGDVVDDAIAPKAIVIESGAIELSTLQSLQAFATERLRALQGVNIRDVMVTLRAFDDGPRHPDSKRMLHELRTRAWGKTVIVQPATGGSPKMFRITQANYGAPKLGIISRGSDVATALVSAQRGDEIMLPAGAFEVIGIAYLEPDAHAENFRHMQLDRDGLDEVAHLDDLARALRLRLDELVQLLRGEAAPEIQAEPIPEVQRSDVERLGAHFYTRATALQEHLMRSEDGLAVVIGVAGSGKTSVALGRTKMLVDRVPEGDEQPFFRSETAIGFVLSGQLCDYLTKTCQALALYDMPVQEIHQLRARLFELRRLDETGFTQSINDEPEPLHGTMAWLYAADRTVFSVLAARIREAVKEPPRERETARKTVAKRSAQQEAALLRLWGEMASAMERATAAPKTAGLGFYLERLASKIDNVRRRFAENLEKDPDYVGSPQRELRQNIRSALRERLIRALRLPDAYAEVFSSEHGPSFESTLREGLRSGERGTASVAVISDLAAENAEVVHRRLESLERGLISAKHRLDQRKLSPADVDVLLALAHVISIGYRGREDRDPISHLTEPDWYSQVFIDEFQDFTEVQLFLMGAQANPERRTVTVVGDYLQRLRQGRRIDLAAAFPWAEGSEREPGVLLENKRQTSRLAALSQRFRDEILGDRSAIEFANSGERARFLDVGPDAAAAAISQEVLRLPRHLSVAVVTASESAARDLERSLRDDLGMNFRDTRYSMRGDLLQRFYVHFTTPLEAKGLEFDAVIIANVQAFELAQPEEAHGCYVAFSRPRTALSVIGDGSALDPRLLKLLTSELVERAPLMDGVAEQATEDST